MKHDFNTASEVSTNSLLNKLNHVMNQSNLVREIVKKSGHLWSMEQTQGNSAKTVKLRDEIARLEELLRISRQ